MIYPRSLTYILSNLRTEQFLHENTNRHSLNTDKFLQSTLDKASYLDVWGSQREHVPVNGNLILHTTVR